MAHHAAEHAHSHEPHPEVGHVVPVRYLVGAGLALLVLTVVTVAVRYVDLGEFNMPLAIGIAVVKATIVALIFMHLRWDRPFNLLVLIGSIIFVLLLIAFASMDVHQYESTLFDGNAPDAQATLDANAPGAPVAQVKPTQGGAAN
jgi:cytochrome c oxidase subunit 4